MSKTKVMCNTKCDNQKDGFCSLTIIRITDEGYDGLYCHMRK